MKEVNYNGHTYKLGELWASSHKVGYRNAGRVTGFRNGKPLITMTETLSGHRSIGEETLLDNSMWEKIEEAPEEKIVFILIDSSTDHMAQGNNLEDAIKAFEDEHYALDEDVVIYEAKVIKVKKEIKYVVEGK